MTATDRSAAEAAFGRLLEIMDTLRSPGGCPWDAQQDHASLAEYLLEETHETLAAIDSGDTVELIEELGDLLLQVVFHARIGEEEDPPWNMADVATGISDKLERRHPHVFGDAQDLTPEEVEANWATNKAAEKNRDSVLDGIPPTLPMLAQSQKTLRRAARLGIVDLAQPVAGEDLGSRVLELVRQAELADQDAEGELRRRLSELRHTIVAREDSAR